MNVDDAMRLRWLYYEIKYMMRIGRRKLYNKIPFLELKDISSGIRKYAGKTVLSLVETNQMIYERISEGQPFWAGRLGGNEMSMIAQYYKNALFSFRTDARKAKVHELYMGAGFFPEDVREGEKFVDLMFDCVQDIDLIGVWNLYMEEWLIRERTSGAAVTQIGWLQPWRLAEADIDAVPWTAALKNKRVLVIHPFAESIRKQYDGNRTRIFNKLSYKEILPEFELITLKAVQSMGDTKVDYDNWFCALEDMTEQCRNLDFDVAIIGCGAYGFPLAAEIKKMGKAAVHLGGVTQLLFGIRGRRWESDAFIAEKVMNEYWVRPLKEEYISDASKIEGACYW